MGLAFLSYRSWAGGAKFRQFFPINFSVYAKVIHKFLLYSSRMFLLFCALLLVCVKLRKIIVYFLPHGDTDHLKAC